MSLFKQEQQQDVSLQRGMPVDIVADSARKIVQTGEVLSFEYYNSGVLTADAGEVAGTSVVAAFDFDSICNDLGDVIGTHKSTSINITAGTAFTTEKPFPYLTAELYDEQTGERRLDEVVKKANLQDGEYVIDYRKGVLYGVKGDATTSITVDYKTQTQTSSSGGGPSADVNLIEVGGSSISLGQTTMTGSLPVAIASDQSSIPVVTGAALTVLSGSATVATAGVPVTLAGAPTPALSVSIQADLANGGNILVGNASNQDVVLVPGDSVTIGIDDLQKIFIDATVNGDSVNYLGSV